MRLVDAVLEQRTEADADALEHSLLAADQTCQNGPPGGFASDQRQHSSSSASWIVTMCWRAKAAPLPG